MPATTTSCSRTRLWPTASTPDQIIDRILEAVPVPELALRERMTLIAWKARAPLAPRPRAAPHPASSGR